MRITRLRSAAAGTGFVIASAAIVLLRQPGYRSWNTIWAEDGALYAHDALLTPKWWHTLTLPYSGYVQLLPRLIGLASRIMPPAWYAAWFAVAAAVITGLLGLVVVHSADGWIGSPSLRWLLGGMLVAGPSLAYEVNASTANLIWPLLGASFWVIASRRQGTAETALRAAVLVTAALSTTLVLLLVPFALLVAAIRRARSDLVMLAALLGALALQGLEDLGAPPTANHPVYRYGDAAKELGVRVLGSMVVGERWLADLYPVHTRLLIVGSIVVLVAVVAASHIRRLSFDRVWLVGGASVTALACFVATTVIRGSDVIGLDYQGRYNNSGSRYVYPVIFLLSSALFVVVDNSGREWLKGLVAAQAALVIVVSLGVGGLRSAGPSWSTGVAQAVTTCRDHPHLDYALIPISPGGWRATVPCTRLR